MRFGVARSTYRWFISVVGRYDLRRMLDDGLPTRFRSPLLFLLNRKLSREDRLVVKRIEAIRSEIAMSGDRDVIIYVSPDPRSAGGEISPEVRPMPGAVKTVSLSWIIKIASVSQFWGTFLYLCANAHQAKTILELGGCAGISGCYMASGKYCKRFITIEGSHDLATLAQSSIRQVANNFVVVNALFDIGLDEILPKLKDELDMVFIDGQHEKIATLHYLERLIPYLNSGHLVVFDDINLSPDMREAWQTLCRWKGMAYTINLGRFGVCVYGGEFAHPKNYAFSRCVLYGLRW